MVCNWHGWDTSLSASLTYRPYCNTQKYILPHSLPCATTHYHAITADPSHGISVKCLTSCESNVAFTRSLDLCMLCKRMCCHITSGGFSYLMGRASMFLQLPHPIMWYHIISLAVTAPVIQYVTWSLHLFRSLVPTWLPRCSPWKKQFQYRFTPKPFLICFF